MLCVIIFNDVTVICKPLLDTRAFASATLGMFLYVQIQDLGYDTGAACPKLAWAALELLLKIALTITGQIFVRENFLCLNSLWHYLNISIKYDDFNGFIA